MNTHWKGTPAPVLALSALALSFACGRSRVAVGVSTSVAYLNAARMAVADAGAAGAIEGLDTVFLGESTNEAGPAVRRADSLVAVPGMVAVVGHSNSQTSLAAAPVYNQRAVVELSPTSSASNFAGSGSFSFSLVPPDERQGAFLAGYLGTLAPAGGRVAVLYVNDDYGRGLHAAFIASLDTARFPVVLDLPHIQSDHLEEQISETAGALRHVRPDLVVWLARGAVLSRYLDSMRAAVPRVPVLGADAVGSGIAEPADPRWAGVRHVAFVDRASSPEVRDFSSRLAKTYGFQGTDGAALTYDAMSLVLAGLRSGARTGEDLRAYLASLGRTRPPFQGITGPISFDAQGRVQRAYVVETLGPAREP